MGERRQPGYFVAALLVAITVGCGASEPTKTTPMQSGGSSNSGGSGAGNGPIGGASLGGAGGTSGGALATGGSAAGNGGSASAWGGTPGDSGACASGRVDAEPGIVAIIAGDTIEFRRDLLWYDGRPPLVELSAATDDPGWNSFRIVIDPGDDTFVPGTYESGPGNITYVRAQNESGEYDSVDNNASIICVNEAGTGAGVHVSGTFSATLANHDGSRSLPASGTFSGTIGAD